MRTYIASVFLVCFAWCVPATLQAQGSDWTQPELVLVPAGSFMMGANDVPRARPRHKVTLTGDFYVGKYEITNQEYADMLNYALSKGYLDMQALSPEAKKREARGVSKSPQKYQDVFDEHSSIAFENGVFAPHPGKERHPVVEVTWCGAAFYCNMLSEKNGLTPLYSLDDWSCQVYGATGYRLPTEAEWEYAARYKDGRKYPWGNKKPAPGRANILRQVKSEAEVWTEPVGASSPKGDSRLGICDMAGNVAEWCNDWYNMYAGSAAETDPVGPPPSLYINLTVFKEFRTMNVLRGGGFVADPEYRKAMGPPFVVDSIVQPDPYGTTTRSYDYRGLSRQVEGFRVVRTVATQDTKPARSAPQN